MPTAKKKRKAVRGAGPNPLRVDPTRTLALREAWAADVKRRFAAVRRDVVSLVGDQDVFGLGKPAGVFSLDQTLNAWDPNQPRDKEGQWTRGGNIPTYSVGGSYPLYHVTNPLAFEKIRILGVGVIDKYDAAAGVQSLRPDSRVSWTRDPAYSIKEGTVRLVIKDKQKLTAAGSPPESYVAKVATTALGEDGPVIDAVFEHEEVTQGIIPYHLVDEVHVAPSVVTKWKDQLVAYTKYADQAEQDLLAPGLTDRKRKLLHLRADAYRRLFNETAALLADPKVKIVEYLSRDPKTGEVKVLNAWNPDQARDDRGRWVSEAIKKLKDLQREDNPGVVETRDVFPLVHDLAGGGLTDDELKAARSSSSWRSVDLTTLTATQKYTDADVIEERIKDDAKIGAVSVLRKGGREYIVDGHHSATTLLLLGRKHVPVKYHDADNPTANASSWALLPAPEKVAAFTAWLKGRFGSLLKAGQDAWTAYAIAGFKKGAGRAFDDVMKAGAVPDEKLDFYEGKREQFLKDSFAHPVAPEKVRLLVHRVMTELQGVADQTAVATARVLADGLTQGKSPRDVGRDLAKTVDGFGAARAATVARTETIRAHAEGQLVALKQLGVEDIGVAVEWATGGKNVCPSCRALNGVILKVDEASGLIPRHPNCVVAETPVSAPGLVHILSAEYSGQVVDFATADGRRFTTTAHHILLTQRGWVFAKDVSELDQLVNTPRNVLVHDPDKHLGEPLIGDVFQAFVEFGDERVVGKAVTAPEDLHGDGASVQSEIHVVRPDRELWEEVQARRGREFVDALLGRGDIGSVNTFGVDGECTTTAFFKRAAATADGLVRGSGVLPMLLGRSLTHNQPHCICPAPDGNPVHHQDAADRQAGNTEYLLDPAGPDPLQIEFDHLVDGKLVRIESVTFRHATNLRVYDVGTETTLYSVCGFVTSNCKCAFIPAGLGEDGEKQKWSIAAVKKAVARSVMASKPVKPTSKPDPWTPPAVSAVRPEPMVITNDLKAVSAALTGNAWDPDQPRAKDGKWARLPGYGDLTWTAPAPGGSTGAEIHTSVKTGKKWIVKKVKPGQNNLTQHALENEAAADAAYRAAGFKVPFGGMVPTQVPGQAVKVTRFVDGVKTLGQWEAGKSGASKETMNHMIAEGFAMDAILGNWDVVGMGKDNILITQDGTPFRADNGGALLYRAQGTPKKASEFGPVVTEFTTMRDPVKNPSAAAAFGHLTDKDVAEQIQDLIPKKDAILAAMTDPQAKMVLADRFKFAEDWAKDKLGAPKPAPAGVNPTGQKASADKIKAELEAGTIGLSPHAKLIKGLIDENMKPGEAVYTSQVTEELEKAGLLGKDSLDVMEELAAAGVLKFGPTGWAITKAGKAAGPDFSTPKGITAAVTAGKGSTPFTDLYLAKLEYLNPHGVQYGVVYIPSFPKGEKSSLEKVAVLEKVLPAGTVIKKKTVTTDEMKAKGKLPEGVVPKTPGKAKAEAGKEDSITKTSSGPAKKAGVVLPPAAKKVVDTAKAHAGVAAAADALGFKKDKAIGPQGLGTVKAKLVAEHGVTPADHEVAAALKAAGYTLKPTVSVTAPAVPAAPKTISGFPQGTPPTAAAFDPTPYRPPVADGNVEFKRSVPPDDEAGDAWAESLTKEEKAAVSKWKSSPKEIRKSIAKGEPTPAAKAILNAIEKAQPHAGMVYRGLHGDYVGRLMAQLEDVGVGGTFVDKAPTGYSLNPLACHSFGNGQLMFRVAAKTVRPIIRSDGFSEMTTSGETECLSTPGTKYTIVGIHKNIQVRDEKNSHSWHYNYVVDLEEVVDG